MASYDDLTRVLRERIEHWEGRAASGNSGFGVQVGDSVATVYGLSGAIYGELVEFASGATGIVLNLEEENVGCVLLSGESLVKEGGGQRRRQGGVGSLRRGPFWQGGKPPGRGRGRQGADCRRSVFAGGDSRRAGD